MATTTLGNKAVGSIIQLKEKRQAGELLCCQAQL